jgi:hypothetical protein
MGLCFPPPSDRIDVPARPTALGSNVRSTLAITLCLAATSACGDGEPAIESAAAAPQSTAPRPRDAAALVVAEAEILARAGMGFQRRWLDWHVAGPPSQDPFHQRNGVIAGYQPGGFDPAKIPEADRAALAEVRAAIRALPPAELRARYRSLIALHGNAPFDASLTGSLRITDDGRHLVYADREEPDIAYAWRIADGRRAAQTGLRTSEDRLMTREALPSGLVWSQFTPTPAGRFLRVWDLPGEEPRSVHRIGEGIALAVSSDGKLAAIATSRGVDIRGGPRLRRLASLHGVGGASIVRRVTGTDDVIGDWEEKSVHGRAAFSGDGTLLALLSVDQDRTRLRLFRVPGGGPVRDLAVSIGDLSHLEVDRTGGRLVGYAPGRNALAVWDRAGERVIDGGAPIDHVALSADGGLALLARGTSLELLDLTSGAPRWTVELAAPARLVALSARAGLAAWWTDAELVVAGLADGRALPTFAGHRSWPDEATHREALALATLLEDPAPPMFEAGFRDPLREPDALDAELSGTYLAWLPRGQLVLLPELIEAHRGKPVRAGGAVAAIVRAWREGCDGWYGPPDPDYTPDDLQLVDRRNLAAIHREIARRGAASPEATPAGSGPAIAPRPCR